MRQAICVVIALVCVVLATGPAAAQMPTGTVTGNVTHNGKALPGVTVTVASPAMQGQRSAVTAANGDYLHRVLPPGDYIISFSLDGFRTLEIPVRVSTAQSKIVDAMMAPEAVQDEIVVTGSYETISSGTQASTTFDSSTMEKLPVPRDIYSAVALAPGVHTTGPGQNITISGAQSHENLFLINGVVVNENIRGQATNLFIEDAIQETTTSTSGVSAEYGRFAGGVVNMITKSGGNEFSGSFRVNLNKETWEGKTPLTQEQSDTLDKVYEATLGGFVWRDKIWFFAAGRDSSQNTTLQTIETLIDIPQGLDETRHEGKLTISPTTSHGIVGSYIKRNRLWTNYFAGYVVDTGDSVYDRSIPEKLWAGSYSGVLTENFLVEAQYSERTLTFVDSGSRFTDIIRGTVVYDNSYGIVGNAAIFCGVCEDEKRNNEDWLAKGSYFLTTGSAGSHDIVFGYDHYLDYLDSNNHQSGSDWWFSASEFAFNGSDWYPVVHGGTSFSADFDWYPILEPSKGSQFKTGSIFVNDTWRYNESWSFNIGVRYDKNDGTNSVGSQVSDDSRVSPRLGVSWDPKGDGDWIFNLSYANYVMTLTNSGNVANQSPGGQPAQFIWFYNGPDINVGCTPGVDCLGPQEVLEQVFDYFNNGFCDAEGRCGTAYNGDFGPYFVDVPGKNRIIKGSLGSPYTEEWSIGVAKRLGSRGILRADYVWREFKDLYETQVNTSTGDVELFALGQSFGLVDFGYITNSDYLKRTYHGVTLSAQYRLSDRLNLGGNYTWSHAYGNFDGEEGGRGPITSSNNPSYYPEYRDVAWSNSSGDLSIDQRHKLRAWLIWDIVSTSRHNLSFSWLENYFSGAPYEAVGDVRSRLYIDNPGYHNAPTSVTYYFTPRGAFRVADVHRTDISFNYSFFVPIAGVEVELFVQPEVVNVFNEHAVIRPNPVVRDRTNSLAFADFDPWTETPIQCPLGAPLPQCTETGAHWQKAQFFGQAVQASDYQDPRTFRVSLGMRF